MSVFVRVVILACIFLVIFRCHRSLLYMFVVIRCHHCRCGIVLHLFCSAACHCRRHVFLISSLPLSTRSIEHRYHYYYSLSGRLSHSTLVCLIVILYDRLIHRSINHCYDFDIKLSTSSLIVIFVVKLLPSFCFPINNSFGFCGELLASCIGPLRD
jgi:hypothetical protein